MPAAVDRCLDDLARALSPAGPHPATPPIDALIERYRQFAPRP